MASDGKTAHDQTGRLVLVTGATGKQGGAVARALLAAGFGVRALTRDPSSVAATQLAALGADLFAGNLDDPDSLRRACEGVQGVFSVQNYWERGVGLAGEVRQGLNLGLAARAAKVGHFVQSSMAQATTFQGVAHFEAKQLVERSMEALGLPLTVVGTVYFMDNLLDPRMGGSMTLPVLAGSLGAHTSLQVMAAQDLGPVVAAIFSDPGRSIGQRVDLAGDVLTVQEMKATYRRVSGRRPKPYALPAWLLRLLNHEFAAQLAWHRQVGWTFDDREARRVYPGMTSFEDFLRQHQVRNL